MQLKQNRYILQFASHNSLMKSSFPVLVLTINITPSLQNQINYFPISKMKVNYVCPCVDVFT